MERRRAETYLNVPRVVLAGTDPEQWPRLPPVYPNASGEWVQAHHHAMRVETARRYGLRLTRGMLEATNALVDAPDAERTGRHLLLPHEILT